MWYLCTTLSALKHEKKVVSIAGTVSAFHQCNFVSGFTGTSAAVSHPCVFRSEVTDALTLWHKMQLCGGGNVIWQPWRNQKNMPSSLLLEHTLPVDCCYSHGLIGSDGSRFFVLCVHWMCLYTQRVGEGHGFALPVSRLALTQWSQPPTSALFPPACILIHHRPTPLSSPLTPKH